MNCLATHQEKTYGDHHNASEQLPIEESIDSLYKMMTLVSQHLERHDVEAACVLFERIIEVQSRVVGKAHAKALYGMLKRAIKLQGLGDHEALLDYHKYLFLMSIRSVLLG